MKRNPHITIPNLKALSFTDVKRMARTLCTKSNAQLENETGIPKETIQRFMDDPAYHPSAINIPLMCKALGNALMEEWIALQCGGHFIKVQTDSVDDSIIETELSDVMREMSHMMKAHAAGIKDGVYKVDELRATQKELLHIIKEAEEASLMIDARIAEQVQ